MSALAPMADPSPPMQPQVPEDTSPPPPTQKLDGASACSGWAHEQRVDDGQLRSPGARPIVAATAW